MGPKTLPKLNINDPEADQTSTKKTIEFCIAFLSDVDHPGLQKSGFRARGVSKSQCLRIVDLSAFRVQFGMPFGSQNGSEVAVIGTWGAKGSEMGDQKCSPIFLSIFGGP